MAATYFANCPKPFWLLAIFGFKRYLLYTNYLHILHLCQEQAVRPVPQELNVLVGYPSRPESLIDNAPIR